MEFQINNKADIDLLTKLGVDVFPEDRNYWFIRTRRGTYYEDFKNEGFVGIEWDKVSDKSFISSANEDDLKVEVVKNYPDMDRPGYIAKQIIKFANDIKKGDIVLIPNEHSEWISFGEILEDDMYILENEEEDFLALLDDFYDQSSNNEERPILKKRRKVKWLYDIKRINLDPYLYGIIYAHNAIVDANPYSLFIDRTLSQFYVKGKKAYFTYKVTKKKNIPYGDILTFLNSNYNLINFINKYSSSIKIDPQELVLKINVQSKGPVQFKGAMKNILIFGLIIGALFGNKMDFKAFGIEYSFETKGLPGLITEINQIIDTKNNVEKETEMKKLINELESDRKRLQIQIPDKNENYKEAPDIDNLTKQIPVANNEGK